MEVLKSQNKSAHVTGYRDVTIVHDAGKILGSMIRKNTKPMVEADAPSTQFGSGLHEGACDIARLTVRAWPHIAQAHSKCLAIIFIDARSAYASVIRSWIAPSQVSTTEWLKRLVAF